MVQIREPKIFNFNFDLRKDVEKNLNLSQNAMKLYPEHKIKKQGYSITVQI